MTMLCLLGVASCMMLALSGHVQAIFLMTSHQVLLYENASMHCLYGNSQPNVTWHGPNGMVISSKDAKYGEIFGDGKSTLVIYNVSETDHGNYTCRGFDGRDAKTQLNILGRILHLEPLQEVHVDKSAHIGFEVKGKPLPSVQVWRKGKNADFLMAKWKSGQPVNINPRFRVSPHWGLNISTVLLEDEGMYEVELGMHGNKAKAGFFMNASEVSPKILKEKTTRYALYIGRRNYVPITCMSEGKPRPVFSLFRGTTPIVDNQTLTYNGYVVNSTWLYKIQSSKDVSNLTCVVANNCGEARQRIVLEEIKLPSKPQGVQVTEKGNRVYLRWSKPSSDGGDLKILYAVRHCLDDTGVCDGGALQEGLSKTVTNLEYASTYLIHVAAVNRRGEGEPVSVKVDIGLKVPLDIVLPTTMVVMALIAIVACFCCYFRSKRAKRRRATALKRTP